MYIKFTIYAILSILFTLLTYILAPLLALWSVVADIDVLPYPFNLFHTHDNTLDGGQKQGYETGVEGFELWWQRTCWIWRNPAYGFKAYVLGFKTEGHKLISVESNNIPFNEGGAKYFSVLEDAKGRRYFSRRYDYKLFGGWYIKHFIGWNYVAYGGEYHQLKNHWFSLKKKGA